MSYSARYWVWTAAYVAAMLALFWGTDLRITWLQVGVLIAAISFHGAAQRNIGRRELT